MEQIRWGILSTAKIGRTKVIPALQKSTLGSVEAIASRSADRARAVAKELDIPRAHGSYEALLADNEIDAVYNPLPNHLHVPWSIRALEAGKHVLCEKPIGLSAEEGRDLVRASRSFPKLKVMEAFMYRFHPQWIRARQLVREQRIGALRAVHSVFSYFKTDPDDIRNKPAMGGGGVMDVGCYNISLSRYLFGSEPMRVVGDMEFDPDLGIDRMASGIMDFEEGQATFTCGTQLAEEQAVVIYGSAGRIEFELPFTMPPDRPAVIWVSRRDTGAREKITFEPSDQYTLQCDAFARAVMGGTPVPNPLDDAIANMEVVEALFKSDKEGRWIHM